MRIAYLFIFLLTGSSVFSQVCPNPGQNPSTAFPVCGTSVFTQNTVPLCNGSFLPSPQCSADQVKDVNPYWYKFTCFTAGTLGFVITPKDKDDDYDWELYDVTGKNPNDIYTNGSLVVSSNWSGEYGVTGASSAGRNLFVCAGPGKALFSSMATLVQGHDYLLLVSHFISTQSGYNLEFKGGTAVITDPTPPKLKKADANCGADRIRVSLNKKMKCGSIALNGSDFVLTPSPFTIVSATGIGCSSKFDTDSVELVLSGSLPPGTYSLAVKNGTDGNTVTDNCNAGIPVNDAVPLVILPRAPTPMDSMAPLKCAPSEIRLVFKKPILCNSIAPDGSDFAISGTYPVAVMSASGVCSNGQGSQIILKLDKMMQQQGNFVLRLQRGTDGNTLTDECNEETPAGSALPFSVKDTVNADFTYELLYGCKEDTLNCSHPGNNGVTTWNWNMDENLKSALQNPQARYKQFTTKKVELIVSNGFCQDTSKQTIALENYLKAAFDVTEDNCPMEPITFVNNSEGKITDHNWAFDDGATSRVVSPDHAYNTPTSPKTYTVLYTVTDMWGCTSTAQKSIKVYPSCILDVPNAFTPNGDNVNDVFYPLNAVKAVGLDFKVYNRWGQLLFSTTNWKKGWDGKYKGVIQPSGIYVWTLVYTDRDTKKTFQKKGTVMLSN